MTTIGNSTNTGKGHADRLTILIVDDRKENLLALKAILGPMGHRLLEATSGKEALQVALREEVHLMLLDVVMPDIDGFEVAAHLKQVERTKNIPIIFLTALAPDVEQFDRAYALGAVDYLTKPLDREIVKRRVAVFAELVEQRREIERQVRRESQLRLSELRVAGDRRYRRLVEGFANAIGWALDDAGQLVFLSRQATHLLGPDGDDLVKRAYFIDRVHPQDRDVVAAMLARCKAERRELSCTHRMIGADCRDVWLFTCVTCELGDNGKPELHGLSTDITVVKRAEEMQSLLADVGAALVQSFDVEDVMPHVAERITASLGDWCLIDELSDSGDLVTLGAAHGDRSRDFGMMLPRARACDPSLGLGSVVHGGPAELYAVVKDAEWLARRTGIDRRVVEKLGAESCMFVPVNVREGRQAVLTVVSSSRRRFGPADLDIASDLAARVALALESASQYRAARRAISAREDLLSVVSHDLRSPLTAIATGGKVLEAAAKKIGDERGARVVGAMLRSANHMERLIGDLLDVAQIDAGQLRVERREVAAAQIVADVTSAFETRARQKGITLRDEVDPTVSVVCDRDRVVQILSNLVGNAVKFTPGNGVITVRVALVDDGVRFSVTDTGSGIPTHDLSEIWGRFWRRERAAGGGVGLGLSIAKSLVDAHDGRIWAESQVGQGSTFTFILPRDAAPTLADDEPAPVATPTLSARTMNPA